MANSGKNQDQYFNIWIFSNFDKNKENEQS